MLERALKISRKVILGRRHSMCHSPRWHEPGLSASQPQCEEGLGGTYRTSAQGVQNSSPFPSPTPGHTGDMGLRLKVAATHTSVSSFLFLSSLLSFSPSFSACPPRTSWSRRCTSSSTLSTCHEDGTMVRKGCEDQRPTCLPTGTHHSEHPGPISSTLVHTDPLVGHGLAEAHLATGQSLREQGYSEGDTRATFTPSPP